MSGKEISSDGTFSHIKEIINGLITLLQNLHVLCFEFFEYRHVFLSFVLLFQFRGQGKKAVVSVGIVGLNFYCLLVIISGLFIFFLTQVYLSEQKITKAGTGRNFDVLL